MQPMRNSDKSVLSILHFAIHKSDVFFMRYLCTIYVNDHRQGKSDPSSKCLLTPHIPLPAFSSFVFLYYCVFLVVVFAPNQLGLISCPSLFRRTNNIANLHNPLIGAMTWSGGITTKRKSSFSSLVFCLFWHSFPFSVWSFIFWIKCLTASEAERRWGLVNINITKFTWSVDFLRQENVVFRGGRSLYSVCIGYNPIKGRKSVYIQGGNIIPMRTIARPQNSRSRASSSLSWAGQLTTNKYRKQSTWRTIKLWVFEEKTFVPSPSTDHVFFNKFQEFEFFYKNAIWGFYDFLQKGLR